MAVEGRAVDAEVDEVEGLAAGEEEEWSGRLLGGLLELLVGLLFWEGG
jgi:hypothetical protein